MLLVVMWILERDKSDDMRFAKCILQHNVNDDCWDTYVRMQLVGKMVWDLFPETVGQSVDRILAYFRLAYYRHISVYKALEF
jgi:hypothetical protein